MENAISSLYVQFHVELIFLNFVLFQDYLKIQLQKDMQIDKKKIQIGIFIHFSILGIFSNHDFGFIFDFLCIRAKLEIERYFSIYFDLSLLFFRKFYRHTFILFYF